MSNFLTAAEDANEVTFFKSFTFVKTRTWVLSYNASMPLEGRLIIMVGQGLNLDPRGSEE